MKIKSVKSSQSHPVQSLAERIVTILKWPLAFIIFMIAIAFALGHSTDGFDLGSSIWLPISLNLFGLGLSLTMNLNDLLFKQNMRQTLASLFRSLICLNGVFLFIHSLFGIRARYSHSGSLKALWQLPFAVALKIVSIYLLMMAIYWILNKLLAHNLPKK